MSKHKVNPKRVPRTEADVRKAKEEGIVDGAEYILTICCETLLTDFDFDRDQMIKFMQRINSKIDSCESGCAKAKDYASAMVEEHDFHLVIKHG